MYKLSFIVFLDHSMISICILSSSDTISTILIKVNLQIYLERWYLYKTDTSLRRTFGHSPKVSVLRGSTVHFLETHFYFLYLSKKVKFSFTIIKIKSLMFYPLSIWKCFISDAKYHDQILTFKFKLIANELLIKHIQFTDQWRFRLP